MVVWIYMYVSFAFGFLVCGSHGLFSPAFVSDWYYMDVNDPSTINPTIEHALGVLPVRVEVQVTTAGTPYISPGVGSSFNNNDKGTRGGVIYMYNETHVRLFGATNNITDNNYEDGEACLAYTGETRWTDEARVKSTTGYVRVRVWHPDDFPPPTNILHTSIRAGSWTAYKELAHDLGAMPNLTIVQYTARHTAEQSAFWDWTMEGQGSSSREYSFYNYLEWGTLLFAVNDTEVRLWVPDYHVSKPGGVFSFCDGWGEFIYYSDECIYYYADVTISMWSDMAALDYYSTESEHSTTETTGTHFEDFPFTVDVDKDMVVMLTEAVSWKNNGFRFYGSGAAMTNLNSYTGGLIYGYTGQRARFWHPLGLDNGLIYVKGVGNSVNNQRSRTAKVVLQVWKYDPCLRTPVIDVFNTNLSHIALGDNCKAVYCCTDASYIHISGDLTRLYYNDNKTWSGDLPVCSYAGSTPTAGPMTTPTHVTTTTTGIPTSTTDTEMTSTTTSEVPTSTITTTGLSTSTATQIMSTSQLPTAPPATTTELSLTSCCIPPLSGVNTNVTIVYNDTGCLATYTCVPGYSRVLGDTALVFNKTLGQWNGTALECYVVCDTLDAVENATVLMSPCQGTNILQSGTLARYTCNPGFTLVTGDHIRMCSFTGDWTGTQPTCEEEPVTSTASTTIWTTTTTPPAPSADTTANTANTAIITTPSLISANCLNNGASNVSMSQVLTVADELVRNLTVDAKDTSKYHRTLISVDDGRTSAMMLGTTGAIICVSIIGLTLASDMLNLTPALRKGVRVNPSGKRL